MERLTEQGKRWIVDVRVGAVAVYLEPQVICFEDEMRGKMFCADGYKMYRDDGTFDRWEVRKEDVEKAHQICDMLNRLAEYEDKVERGEFVEVENCDLCVYADVLNQQYPCNHCSNCHTSKFKQRKER